MENNRPTANPDLKFAGAVVRGELPVNVIAAFPNFPKLHPAAISPAGGAP
jgi:hypothetical protein